MRSIKITASGIVLLTIVGWFVLEEPAESFVADLPYYNEPSLTPIWSPTHAHDEEHTIGTFRLKNQEGEVITDQTLHGKVYVASFFFVHCTSICPSLRTNLTMVQDAFQNEDDVLIVSHTIAPEVDTVPVLQNYATVNEIDSDKWHLLTGTGSAINDLARDSYFVDLDSEREQGFQHTETLVLVDREGRIRGVYTGTLKFEVEQLIQDIDQLLLETV